MAAVAETSDRDPWREKGTVYLLHFEQPYKHARHYLGWTLDLDDRLARHRGEKEKDGRGARLVEVVIAAGISVQLARTWNGDRFFERHIKGRGLTAYCPVCTKHPRNPVGGVETFRANGGTMTKSTHKNSSTDKRRWVVRQKSKYGSTRFYIVDQEAPSSGPPLMALTLRSWADGVVRELARDPKFAPGAKVKFTEEAGFGLGASEPDELHRVTEDRYGAGDVGVLAHPHPNQAADGCVGWWYVEVDSKLGEPRKLYVGVWREGLEVLP